MVTSILTIMEVQLTPEQEALVKEGIRAGRYESAEEAIGEALHCWEEVERRRAEIIAAFDDSEADIKAGRFKDHTSETLSQLGQELKVQGRARLQTRRNTS